MNVWNVSIDGMTSSALEYQFSAFKMLPVLVYLEILLEYLGKRYQHEDYVVQICLSSILFCRNGGYMYTYKLKFTITFGVDLDILIPVIVITVI
jgi:hypothetical protein